LDALTTAFQSEIDATARDGVDLSDPSAYRSHRTTLEIYAFLLMWFQQAAERYINTARAGDDGEQATGKKKVGSCPLRDVHQTSKESAETRHNRVAKARMRKQVKAKAISRGQTRFNPFCCYFQKHYVSRQREYGKRLKNEILSSDAL
jgi:hypothetical protein